MRFLTVNPTDSDFIAQIKIATTVSFVAVMVFAPAMEYMDGIDGRAYKLAAMFGFAIGTCVKRSSWTSPP